MNTSVVRYIIGHIIRIEGILLLIPMLCGLYFGENHIALCYLAVSIGAVLFGCAMTIKKPKDWVFYLKEGCVTTAVSWIVMSIFGALPLRITGEVTDYVDALFEIVSGFTTTGSSIMDDIEALSHATLLWRSLTHWVGGMGVLVFLLAIIPLTGGGGSYMNLMRAESPGPSVGKLGPKLKYTARALYITYLALTVLEFIFLIAGDMGVFEAINTSISTAGTGGFAIKNDSLASASAYSQWVVAVFMILFGVNFNFYYLLVFKQAKKALAMEEVKVYLGVVLGASALISTSLIWHGQSLGSATRDAVFSVATIISTTGFGTADFDLWSTGCKVILVLLMFSGACAGSTGGGIKISRIVIMFKLVKREIHAYLHPHSVENVTLDDAPIATEVLRSVNSFLYTYAIMFIVSLFIISMQGFDLITSFTSIVASMSNIGPGLAKIGPTCNYTLFNHTSQFVLMFDMLAGRLELFPMLILFTPSLWKTVVKKRYFSKESIKSSK